MASGETPKPNTLGVLCDVKLCVLCRVMCCDDVRFGVIVEVSESSLPYDLSQSVEFGSGAVHLVVVQSVFSMDNKAIHCTTLHFAIISYLLCLILSEKQWFQ